MVVVWWSILAKRLPISATAELFVCIVHHLASLYFTMGRPSPLKIAPFHGGSRPPSNIWFLGPNGVPNPNGISIGSTIFAGLTSVTDRQTDRLYATWSVAIGRIYVRCGLKISSESRKGYVHTWRLYLTDSRAPSIDQSDISLRPGLLILQYCCYYK